MDSPKKRPAPKLSLRERQVLELIVQGLTNKEIGARLVLSEKAIERLNTRLFRKLSVRNRAQATAWHIKDQQQHPSGPNTQQQEPSQGESFHPSWRIYLAESHWLATKGESEAARRMAKRAADEAPSREAKARATAEVAHRWWSFDNAEEALRSVELAFDLLGLADVPPPGGESALGPDEIAARVQRAGRAYGLETFAILARVAGNVQLDNEPSGATPADVTFARMEAAARRLQDPRLTGDALLRRADAHLVRGTDIDWKRPHYWRRLTNGRAVEQAGVLYGRALEELPVDDLVRRAYALRGRAKVLRLQDNHAAASDLEEQSAQLYQDAGSASMVSIHLHRGRWAAVREEVVAAQRELFKAVDLAHYMLSPNQLSKSLIMTSYLFADRGFIAQAVDYCVAAMIGWPYSESMQDYQRMRVLYEDLRRELESVDLDRFVRTDIAPLNVVSDLPNYAGRVDRVRSYLERFESVLTGRAI